MSATPDIRGAALAAAQTAGEDKIGRRQKGLEGRGRTWDMAGRLSATGGGLRPWDCPYVVSFSATNPDVRINPLEVRAMGVSARTAWAMR